MVVVSREPFNRGTHVCVVPFASAAFAKRSGHPHNVPLPAGVLDDIALRDVIRAIGGVTGADGGSV